MKEVWRRGTRGGKGGEEDKGSVEKGDQGEERVEKRIKEV